MLITDLITSLLQHLAHLDPLGPFSKVACGKSLCVLITRNAKLILFGEYTPLINLFNNT